jgi:predicted metal-binding membrane protein
MVSSTRRWGRRLPLLPGWIGLVGAAWIAVLAAYAGGHAAWFGHNLLATPGPWSVGVGLAAGGVMTLAMMGPSCLPMARYVAANTLRPRQTVAAFFAGYLAPWTGFFAVFALADGMAHALLGPGSAAAPGAYLITGIAVALAAAWQLTTGKRKLLNACRRVDLLPAHGRQADLPAVRLGVLQGANCVGSCGPLMLAMLGAASGRLALMVLIAVLARLEATRTGRRLARPSAAVLAAIALTYGLVGLSALAAQHGWTGEAAKASAAVGALEEVRKRTLGYTRKLPNLWVPPTAPTAATEARLVPMR